MRVRGPIYFRILLWFFGFYVVFGALTQCASSAMLTGKKTVEEQFANREPKPVYYTYEALGREMHYVQIGDINKPMIVFVHGSPGGWDAYLNYFKDTALTNHACLVSVDRPGYGGSGAGFAEPSMEAQAAMLLPILKTSKSKHKPILAGHSLGGPIIARMAMDYPKAMSSLLFLAPSIDPAMEKKEPYRFFLKLGIVQAVLPKMLVASNLELMPLKSELDKMLPLWQNIKVPCTIMHGTKDILVPYANVAFYEKMLVNASKKEVVTFDKENHFIIWSQFNAVKSKLLEQLSW